MASDDVVEGLLAQALQAWDSGDVHSALQLCDRMSVENDEGRYTAALLRARILAAMGNCVEALSTLEAVADPRIEDSLLDGLRGEMLFMLGHFSEAQAALESAVRSDPEYGKAFHLLGVMNDYLGEPSAEYYHREARRIDPKTYKPAFKMSLQAFTDALVEALKNLPERVQYVLERVPLVVLEYPKQEDVRIPELGLTPMSLGLFVGVVEAAMGAPTEGFLPEGHTPKVVLFRRNIEQYAGSKTKVVKAIEELLLAEISLPSLPPAANDSGL